MKNAWEILKKFLAEKECNKIIIVLIVVSVLIGYDRREIKNELKSLRYERKRTDSTYNSRLNRISIDFQQKIDDCNKERVENYLKQSEMWEKKFDELFKETDRLYHQQKKLER